MAQDDGQWHLDKRVPIALIVTLVFQAAAGLWWASGVNNRVLHLEQISGKNTGYNGRIIRVEERLKSVLSTVDRIEKKLDRDYAARNTHPPRLQ